MTGESTSPVRGENHAIVEAKSAREEWRNYLSFLKRPQLPANITGAGSSTRGLARMLMLDLIIMTVFIGVLMGIVSAGFELPENLNSSLELNLTTVALVVIVAPLLEELGFRSWLSGRPAYLFAILLLVIAGAVGAILGASMADEAAQASLVLSVVVGLILALIIAIVVRKRPTPDWYRSIFPALFWLSAIGFGLIHLLNYPEEGVLLLALPLVIPQFVLGTILGYVRVHYGLWTAIVLHALHNGFALSVAALAMESGMG